MKLKREGSEFESIADLKECRAFYWLELSMVLEMSLMLSESSFLTRFLPFLTELFSEMVWMRFLFSAGVFLRSEAYK